MTKDEAIKMLRDKLQRIQAEMQHIKHPAGCEGGNWDCPGCAIDGIAEQALAATEHVDDGMTLRPMPEDWSWVIETLWINGVRKIHCIIFTKKDDEVGVHAFGATPRAAVLAAIAKIEGKK